MRELRHCLVVAASCERLGRLARLATTAGDLVRVLRDPQLGVCDPGLPDGTDIIAGDLTAETVRVRVDEAIRYAGANRATLIVALLGHGFVLGNTGRLFYMAHDSVPQVQVGAVNVPELFSRAADHPNVNGVIGIVDTCMAGGALPDSTTLVGGARSGDTHMYLLMAASAAQIATDLQVSRGIVEIVKVGVSTANDEFLRVPEIRERLRLRVDGQTITSFDYDGDSTGAPQLWLSRNRSYVGMSTTADRTMGPEGLAQMAAAYRELDPYQGRGSPSLNDLRLAVASTPGRAHRAAHILAALTAVHSTVELIRRSMPNARPLKAFVRALALLDRSGMAAAATAPMSNLRSEVDYVEHVAFQRGGRDGDLRTCLAWFVAALAAELDPNFDERTLLDWADELNANPPMTDALRVIRLGQQRQRLRLVVQVPGLTGRWPEGIFASLHETGRSPARRQFPCAANAPGAEDALKRAITWAHALAWARGHRLWHVDVVAPTAILLTWRPEDIEHVARLGLDYQVSMHWSGRFSPSAASINQTAANCLDDMDTVSHEQIMVWLRSGDYPDLSELRRKLLDKQHRGALGVDRHPGDNVVLAELLLTNAPISMWPLEGVIGADVQQAVTDSWPMLPEEFGHAYRRWRQFGTHEPLTKLRSVWEHREWLELCAVFQRQSTRRSLR